MRTKGSRARWGDRGVVKQGTLTPQSHVPSEVLSVSLAMCSSSPAALAGTGARF